MRVNKEEPVRHYNESVTDDDLHRLPVSQFGGNIVLIDSFPKLRAALPRIRKASLLGFDTETKPSFKKGRKNKVSLLQLSDDHHAWLIRLNKIGLPQELTVILEEPSITKVGVAIHDDVRALRSLKNFEPAGFIDLQNRVSDHGIKQLGLKKLAAIVLGFSISKSQQVSNWEAQVLTWAQQMYAATDAWVCRQIYLKLNGQHGQ